MSASSSFDVASLAIAVLLGGLLGMVGQDVRVIVGLKKQQDEAAAKGKTFADGFQPSRLVLSLVIGFIAGALGILTVINGDAQKIMMNQVLTVIAIGYAGTDFIEGCMARYLPGSPARASAGPQGTTVPSTGGGAS